MSDFGAKLRQAREGRGTSLRQIAANTKISVAALEALERNDVSKLPGGIFSRAFVRSYAAEVGLDPEQTVREFLERFDSEPAPEPHLHVPVADVEQSFENRQRAVMLALKALVGLAIVSSVVGYFVWKGKRAATDSAALSAPPAEAAAPAPAPPPVAVGSPQTSPVAAPSTGVMRIDVHPTGVCWVRLTVDGKVLLARIMQPGERQTVNVHNAATIDVGDASAFAFSIDGRPGRSLGNPGQVTSVRITPATVAQFLR